MEHFMLVTSMSNYLLAFDPGKTCGWALFDVPGNEPAFLMACGEVQGTPTELRGWWAETPMHAIKGLTVVCEDWTRNDRSVDSRLALHPTGMLMMLSPEPVVFQYRQFRLSVPDTEEGLGTYWRANLKYHDDQRQAIRHGLAHIVWTMGHLPTMKVLFPR